MLRELKRGFDMTAADRHESFPVGTGGCPPYQVQPHPEVSTRYGPVHDEVQGLLRDCTGEEGLADPALEDVVDLVAGIGGEVDLHRLEDGHHAGIQFPREIGVDVAYRRNHPDLGAGIRLVGPKQDIQHVVEQPFRHEVVGIIEADCQHHLPLHHSLPNLVEELPAGVSQDRRGVPEETGMDLRQDGIERSLTLAVHIDRNHPLGGLLHLGKDPLHAGSLPGPREAPEDGIERS